MRLTPRWRIVLLLALACVVGFWYFTWALHTGRNVVRQARFGVVICSNSLGIPVAMLSVSSGEGAGFPSMYQSRDRFVVASPHGSAHWRET